MTSTLRGRRVSQNWATVREDVSSAAISAQYMILIDCVADAFLCGIFVSAVVPCRSHALSVSRKTGHFPLRQGGWRGERNW